MRPVLFALHLCCFASATTAGPITYSVSGTASGTIGASSFTNAFVQVVVSGDTANIVPVFSGIASASPATGTTVFIAGVGTALVNVPVAIYSFSPVSLEPGFPVLPFVSIGTLDAPPSLDSFTGLAGLGSDGLLGYGLQTSFDPLTASPGGVFYPGGLSVPTTLGVLSFSANLTPSSVGTFSATGPPVGLTQNDPVLPGQIVPVNGVPVFMLNGESGWWYDPPGVYGFDYAGANGTLFTQVGLPAGFADPFLVSVPDGAGGYTVLGSQGGGATFSFGSPVPAFRITGIRPAVNSDNPDAFPTQLFFSTQTGTFTMTPLSDVPEPSTLAMLAVGGACLALRRRW